MSCAQRRHGGAIRRVQNGIDVEVSDVSDARNLLTAAGRRERIPRFESVHTGLRVYKGRQG